MNFLNGMVTKFVMMETTMRNVNGMEEIVVEKKNLTIYITVQFANVNGKK